MLMHHILKPHKYVFISAILYREIWVYSLSLSLAAKSGLNTNKEKCSTNNGEPKRKSQIVDSVYLDLMREFSMRDKWG